MKAINVYFEDDDFEKLKKTKKNKTWRNFILYLYEKEDKKNVIK